MNSFSRGETRAVAVLAVAAVVGWFLREKPADDEPAVAVVAARLAEPVPRMAPLSPAVPLDPEDLGLPIYPDSRLDRTIAQDAPGWRVMRVASATDQPVETVVAFYSERLPTATRRDTPTGITLAEADAEGAATVQVSRRNNETVVTLERRHSTPPAGAALAGYRLDAPTLADVSATDTVPVAK